MVDTNAIMLELPKALSIGVGAYAGLLARGYVPDSVPEIALLGLGGLVGAAAYNYVQTMVIAPDLSVKTLAGAAGAIVGKMYMDGPIGVIGGGALGDLLGAYFSP